MSIFYSRVLRLAIAYIAQDTMGKILGGITQSGAKNVPHGELIHRERREKHLEVLELAIPIKMLVSLVERHGATQKLLW